MYVGHAIAVKDMGKFLFLMQLWEEKWGRYICLWKRDINGWWLRLWVNVCCLWGNFLVMGEGWLAVKVSLNL